jgi:hypothetical protein
VSEVPGPLGARLDRIGVCLMPALDYSLVADVYDRFLKADLDVASFREDSKEVSGDVLKLMCGTGHCPRIAAKGIRSRSGRLCGMDRLPWQGVLPITFRLIALKQFQHLAVRAGLVMERFTVITSGPRM